MRKSLQLIILTLFVLVLEASAQTGSTEITPDTRLCWYQPFARPGPAGPIVDFPFVVGKIPAPQDASTTCLFYATCNEVMGFKKTRSGGTTGVVIPPGGKHRRTVPTAVVAITDCNSYGAGKVRKSVPVTLGTYNVGRITKIKGKAFFKFKGERNWIVASESDRIRPGMSVRTGPGARLRLNYVDQTDLDGPEHRTSLRMGANTEIRILTRQEIEEQKTAVEKLKGALWQMKGTIRVVTEETLGIFKVLFPGRTPGRRGGGCGIRGSAVAITRDPGRNTTEVFLDHGDAYVEYGTKKVTLAPRSSLKIVNDRIGKPRRMGRSIWNDLVVQTDAQDDVAGLDFPGPDEPDMPVNSNASDGEFEDSFSDLLEPDDSNLPVESDSQNKDADADLFMPGNSNEPADPNASEWGADIDRQGARETVDSLLDSMKNNDQTKVLNVTSGLMRSVYLREFEKYGSLKAMLDKSGKRPATWKHECSVCTNAGNSCMASVNITMASGKAMKYILSMEKGKVTDARPANGETLRVFQAKKPVCGEKDLFDDF